MIAAFLKQRKDDLNLSLSDIETQLNLLGFNVTRSTVGHWMAGTRKPPLKDRKFLDALSTVYKMPIADMLDKMGLVDIAADMSPEARRAVDLIDHMPPEKRKMALDVLEAMAR